jgi:tetratricopeptide (TPR) repeat protein
MPTVRSTLLLLIVSGCSGSSSSPPATERPEGVMLCYSETADQLPATQNFWTALRAADLAARPAALMALADAARQYPNEEEVALLNGLGNLWRVAEPAPSEVQDTGGFINAALTSKSEVQRAFTLCPTDYRIPAWLGPILVNMGRQLNDQMTIDQGLEVLQTGIDHYPSFVLFSKLLVYADRPATDPDFQMALAAVDANVGACGDWKTSHDPACKNSEHAAHNVEGAAVFMGDAYGKAGRHDDALAAYQTAMQSSDYATWPFRSLLEDRISGLDARVAAWADADPSNDPDAAWTSTSQCSLCHEK